VYLQNHYNISSSTLKARIITAKNFLEYYDVDLSPRKFKLKVKIPKLIRKNKEALSKEDVIDILNACSDIRLKTYVMLLAATGFRAVEALSIRIKDLHLDSRPPKIFVRGEYTKTKTDRYIFLTEELAVQLKQWMEYSIVAGGYAVRAKKKLLQSTEHHIEMITILFLLYIRIDKNQIQELCIIILQRT
jgi:integrase